MHPGQLLSHFLNTAIVTAVVAALIMWRYRAGVLAGMGAGGSTALSLPAPLPRSTPTGSVPAAEVGEWERRLRRRLTAAVVSSVLVCALPLAYLLASIQVDIVTPVHVLIDTGGLLVAAVPMVALLLALSFRRSVWFAAWLLAAAALAVVLVSMIQRLPAGRLPSLDQVLNAYFFLQVTAVNAALPTLALLATTFPRVRGVAPMTLVGLLVFSLAPLGGTQLTRALMATRAGGEVALRTGLGLGFALLAVPTGWMAWRSLDAVGRAFERKGVSESEVLAHAWWVLFVALFAIEWVNVRGAEWIPLTACAGASVGFAVLYRLVVARAVPAPRPPRRTVLLLRVFADEARTERLFDRVAARWRWLGPLTVIAAPDVVARTMDPRDFLQYATGRLDAQFVKSAADLGDRLAHLDLEPDPDGRYRVNELCCQVDTWRAAVVSLMDRADAVLMDLRDFSKKRAGCAFELQQLAERIDPRRVLLAVDATTDRELIATHLGSRGARIAELEVHVVRDSDFDRLFAELVAAAYDPGAVTSIPLGGGATMPAETKGEGAGRVRHRT